jgi:sulfur-oxidizing protein SoxY
MSVKRRKILQAAAAAATAALGLRISQPAAAAEWNKAAFGASAAADVLKTLGATGATPSKDILFKAPDVAENGAAVPIEVTSRIPNTQSITIVADKNPSPLVASFEFAGNAEPYASTRMKLAESSQVRVLVRAEGRYYVAVREIKVTIGGCG